MRKCFLFLVVSTLLALNDIKFKETPEEWERMKVVNSRLFELTKELRLKMADVCDGLAKRFLTRELKVLECFSLMLPTYLHKMIQTADKY